MSYTNDQLLLILITAVNSDLTKIDESKNALAEGALNIIKKEHKKMDLEDLKNLYNRKLAFLTKLETSNYFGNILYNKLAHLSVCSYVVKEDPSSPYYVEKDELMKEWVVLGKQNSKKLRQNIKKYNIDNNDIYALRDQFDVCHYNCNSKYEHKNHCLCSHGIKYRFYALNILNRNIIIVGSCCVNKF